MDSLREGRARRVNIFKIWLISLMDSLREEITQRSSTRKVCVDKIQTPATRKNCVDKMRTGGIRTGIGSENMGSEPAAGGSGQVAYPPPPGMLPHLPTFPRTYVTRLALIDQDCHLLGKKSALRAPFFKKLIFSNYLCFSMCFQNSRGGRSGEHWRFFAMMLQWSRKTGKAWEIWKLKTPVYWDCPSTGGWGASWRK